MNSLSGHPPTFRRRTPSSPHIRVGRAENLLRQQDLRWDRQALEALPFLEERERTVLRLRFVEDMTQSQIAEQIGHSQMHVSRILRRALAKIRERIEVERGRDG